MYMETTKESMIVCVLWITMKIVGRCL
jgi:hypothetical protein